MTDRLKAAFIGLELEKMGWVVGIGERASLCTAKVRAGSSQSAEAAIGVCERFTVTGNQLKPKLQLKWGLVGFIPV